MLVYHMAYFRGGVPEKIYFSSQSHVCEEQLQVRFGAVAKQADARKRSTRIATMPRQDRKHAAEGPNPFDF